MRIALAVAIAASLAFAPARADLNPEANQNSNSAAGVSSQITLPVGTDDYARLVGRAAMHDEAVDFRALRFSHLTSPERKGGPFDTGDLEAALKTALQSGDDQAIEKAAITLLSSDYTDGFAHTYLMIACDHLHDSACFQQERFVGMGLQKSILATGDGKTCPTGWEVASVHEEYFILATLGAKMKFQALMVGKPNCDMLSAEDSDGKPVTYWFKIDAVLKDETSGLGAHR